MKLKKHQAGLALGSLFALLHLLWSAAVGFGWGAAIYSWLLRMHFIELNVAFTPFNWLTALLLVIRAFIAGYLIGLLFSFFWNKFEK